MAKKTVVVDLDLNGNKISKAVIDSTGQTSYGGIKYNHSEETIDVYTDSDDWEHLITQSTYDGLSSTVTNIQTSLTETGSVGSEIKANTDFREGKSTLTAALTSTQSYEGLEIDLNGNSIILSWKGNTISSFDASSFIIDGMVTGAHVITYDNSGYSYEGGAILIGTTVIDGKTVTNDSTEHSMPTGATYGKYLRMVLSSDPVTAVWVNLQDLVDAYTPGDGIDITNNVISVNLPNNSGLEADSVAGLSVKLDGSSIGVSSNGLKVADSIAKRTVIKYKRTISSPNSPDTTGGSTKSATVTAKAASASENVEIISAKAYLKSSSSATSMQEIVTQVDIANESTASSKKQRVVTFTWNVVGLASTNEIVLEVCYECYSATTVTA